MNPSAESGDEIFASSFFTSNFPPVLMPALLQLFSCVPPSPTSPSHHARLSGFLTADATPISDGDGGAPVATPGRLGTPPVAGGGGMPGSGATFGFAAS